VPGAPGQDDEDRQFRDPARQFREAAQRRVVGDMGVVDRKDHRPARGHLTQPFRERPRRRRQPLDQLPDHTQRVLPFARRGRRRQEQRARSGRPFGDHPEQRRLAHARRAADHDEPAPASAPAGEDVFHARDITIALAEPHSTPVSVRHPAISRGAANRSGRASGASAAVQSPGSGCPAVRGRSSAFAHRHVAQITARLRRFRPSRRLDSAIASAPDPTYRTDGNP
jgi:hypothetical protein